MPKIGKKKKLIRDLNYLFLFKLSQNFVEPTSSPDVIQSLTTQFIVQNEIVHCVRYASDRTLVRKTKDWIEDILPFLRGGRFRQQLRVNKATFKKLLSLLQGDPEFHAGIQASVDLQLAVTLFRLGRDGNGSSIIDVSSRFGISEGSVCLFTSRIIKAINKTLHFNIKWPNEAQMEKSSLTLHKKGFYKCIGFVDGTHIPFYDKPLDCPEDYFSRKQLYAMQLQLIVNEDKKIIHMYTGLPASVHDSTAFRRSEVDIADGFYILGDSAYANTDSVITPFRRRIGDRPVKERVFNKQHSRVRVNVEHAIGILKNRFQSLKGVRVRVDKDTGHRRVCDWITACCILYNIIQEDDPWTEFDPPEEYPCDDDYMPNRERTTRRALLMEEVWRLKIIDEI